MTGLLVAVQPGNDNGGTSSPSVLFIVVGVLVVLVAIVGMLMTRRK